LRRENKIKRERRAAGKVHKEKVVRSNENVKWEFQT
jgi:hypothetical protein